MNVVKRNGITEEVSFDKIHKRIKYLTLEPYELTKINTHTVAQHVIQGLYDGVRTTDIDTRSAIVCANLSIQNYEYGVLAGRIAINNHQKNTLTSFKDKVSKLYFRKDASGNPCPIVNTQFYKFVKKHQKAIENYIDYNRDFLIDFFGFKTLEKSYLLKLSETEIVERPQDLFMRVAIFLHMNSKDMNKIFETYDLLSLKYFTHATPTLFNSGLIRPSLASCFLIGSEDSLEGIFKTLTDCAHISKWSGGIGFHISNWRGSGSLIRGTGGNSSGIIPFLKIFEKTSLAVNQGGRRPGSFAPYIEPHHPDIIDFIALSKKNGDESARANKLYLALWISDLFMKRVRDDLAWSTFCPDLCPGLSDTYGEEYEELYTKYEKEGKAVWTCRAREIWMKIFESQKESGFPYILYKDTINRYSNQKNIGVIKSSNLCVSGDTKVLTFSGYYPIKDLVKQKPNHYVWNGREWSNATFAKTSDAAELIQIEFSDGNILKCTPEHKFYIIENKQEKEICAKDLQVNMTLNSCVFPTISLHSEKLSNAYEKGKQFSEVPIQYCIESKLEWLSGMIDASNGYQISHHSHEYLLQIKYMCNTLSTNPFIQIDSTGSYCLIFSDQDISELCKKGLQVRKLQFENTYYYTPFVTIKSITSLPDKEPTYCFNEPLRHRGIFNGIYTGQCSEIVEYSSSTEYAVCSLTSICLPRFVEDTYSEEELQIPESERRRLNHDFPKYPVFNYDKFKHVIEVNVRNLNRVIDINYYPVPETKRSNLRHRPIGIGVQGLANVFFKFNITFDSEQAKLLNRYIFETLYYTALSVSTKICRETYIEYKNECIEHGKVVVYTNPVVLDTSKVTYTKTEYTNVEDIPSTIGAYPSYLDNGGSPLSKGLFHWEMMGLKQEDLATNYDWESLRHHILKFGVCNSLLIALMPTASTSQIMGNIESFEPLMSNIFIRNTLAGEFIVVNKYLMHDLQELGIWDKKIENWLKLNNGSIQSIEGIPQHIKDKYRTVWEIPQKALIDLAAERQPFIDQSQSLNLHIEDLKYSTFSSMHMYSWKKGVKTGCYYLRTKEATTAQKFTVDEKLLQNLNSENAHIQYTPPKITGPEESCLVCGS
jgi:ribonucleoside-diphosphate reductase alpha chain